MERISASTDTRRRAQSLISSRSSHIIVSPRRRERDHITHHSSRGSNSPISISKQSESSKSSERRSSERGISREREKDRTKEKKQRQKKLEREGATEKRVTMASPLSASKRSGVRFASESDREWGPEDIAKEKKQKRSSERAQKAEAAVEKKRGREKNRLSNRDQGAKVEKEAAGVEKEERPSNDGVKWVKRARSRSLKDSSSDRRRRVNGRSSSGELSSTRRPLTEGRAKKISRRSLRETSRQKSSEGRSPRKGEKEKEKDKDKEKERKKKSKRRSASTSRSSQSRRALSQRTRSGSPRHSRRKSSNHSSASLNKGSRGSDHVNRGSRRSRASSGSSSIKYLRAKRHHYQRSNSDNLIRRPISSKRKKLRASLSENYSPRSLRPIRPFQVPLIDTSRISPSSLHSPSENLPRFGEFSVVIEDLLYLGDAEAAQDIEQLLSNRVTHILNVADDVENFFGDNFVYCNLKVQDFGKDIGIGRVFKEALGFFRSCESAGGRLFVHCFAGQNRSVTIAIIILMTVKNMSLREAYRKVRTVRHWAHPLEDNQKALIEFEIARDGKATMTYDEFVPYVNLRKQVSKRVILIGTPRAATESE
eukprot:TRINITY_DN11368_c0_g1_i1.p1 TRINITY_DN11368_c0_g1~~TRINITY_DN11368_c0_g1_i1.p1  ORF type:complete len:595 (+),score=117.31 TRINITY_DN11368_c0_g1_i1:298-2082(+)